jgi:hypothetical protein
MKVQNMTSNRTGREVPNQFDIVDDYGNIYFQSYKSIIVAIKGGKTYLDKNKWNYSRTTSKYRNQFLDEDTAATKAKIDCGTYELIDLNS